VIGLALTGFKENTFFEAHHILKGWTRLIGETLLSAGTLLMLLQLPLIRNEIENYFVTAFSSSEFVRNFKSSQLSQIIRKLLHAYYTPTDDETYVDATVDLMGSFAKPYVSSHKESIHVKFKGDRVTKHIVRNCTVCLRHIPHNKISLLRLLQTTVMSNRVLFENDADFRHYDRLSICIDNKQAFDFGIANSPCLAKGGGFITHSPVTNTIQYAYASKVDWAALLKDHPKLRDFMVEKDQCVTINSAEWRETGPAGATFSQRFFLLTHAPQINLTVDGDDPSRRIRGFMYGNGLRPDNVSVIDTTNSLSMGTNGWLYAGCGCTIIIDKTRETKGARI